MPLASASPPSRRLRRATAIGVAVLVAALGSAWVLWRPQLGALREPPAVAGRAAPEVAPPAPGAGVPPPIVPGRGEAPVPRGDTGGSAQADGDETADAIHPPGAAYEPVPTSDDPDLSLARRAGLHRAPNPLQLTASVALAVDGETGELLYGRNELAILPIASLTKLLTAMVLVDARLPMSQRIRIAREDVDTMRHSRSRLRMGTTLTRAHALQLALMSSENRAAHALARTYPGGVPAFVAQMNRKAAELGMSHSRFADPTGLSSENRATAQDVATLVVAASKYTLVRRFSTTSRHLAVLGTQRLQYLNSNRLVRHSDWPITVQKTGYIVESGQCLAMLTLTEGRPLVLVVMDAGSFKTRTHDARKLRRWAAREIDERRPIQQSAVASGGLPP